MKKLFLFFFSLGYTISLFGINTDSVSLYKEAFTEQLQMLNGAKQTDFKRAVFISENAYHNGKLNYEIFTKEISDIGKKLKNYIKVKGMQPYKTAGNWAVFTFMTDTLEINNYKPYTYDFDDFMGEKDWTKMFVTKLMKTKGGNCHSLPYWYKILCKEIGVEASLALAPNHVYIKHIDEQGQWANVELTNAGFPRDQWIIREMGITVEAIINKIYMQPLTEKESIALCMFDLASGYQVKFGADKFALQMLDTALHYFPKCVPMLMLKANCIDEMIEKEKEKNNSNGMFVVGKKMQIQQINNIIDSLGHKQIPIELYEEWVRTVEEEKEKRGYINK